MAKWIRICHTSEKVNGVARSYIGWYRRHPEIHVTANGPASKTSLVQIHQVGNVFSIYAQTIAHNIFTQPPGTKGTPLFKGMYTRNTKASAMAEAARLKRMLASKYDKVTGITR